MKIRLFGIGEVAVILVLSLVTITLSQAPPRRLQIPGAIPLGNVGIDRQLPIRRIQQQQPQYQAAPQPVRLRRPIPNAIPAPLPAIRPVVEEPDDLPQSSLNLNDEAARLSSIPLPSAPRQQLIEEDDEEPPQPKYVQPLQFRPERPAINVAQPVRAPPQPIRQVQPVRQAPIRQVSQPVRRPQPQYAEDDENVPRQRQDRRKKPEVKILRKYRDDNPDGSITWGFENDDGTFKEEIIGIDCITRGKYGYIDPDGNRREYTYETGLKCDQPEELEEEPLLQPAPGKNYKRPPPQQIRLQ